MATTTPVMSATTPDAISIMLGSMLASTIVLATIAIVVCCRCCWKEKPRPKRDVEAKGQTNQQQKAKGRSGQHVAHGVGGSGVQYVGLEKRPYVAGNNYDMHGLVPPPPSLSTQVSVPSTIGPLDDQLPFNALQLLENTIVERTIDRVHIAPKRLHLGQPIGRGQFGLVYKGQLYDKDMANPCEVAVKTVQGDKCREADVKSFMEEVMVMKSFDHPNVMTMLGLVIRENKPYVCLPFMHHGDLKSFISEPQRNFQVVELLLFGLQVAQGMEYLAKQSFVHRDLAARNCMVNNNLEVKVADFGLSRDLYEKDYYTMEESAYPLPVRWMSVEAITKQMYSTSSDVWSYGVLLWELMTRGAKPYHEIADSQQVIKFVMNGDRLACPSNVSPEIYALMLKCWETKPEDRPDFKEISETLGQIVSGVNEDDISVDNV